MNPENGFKILIFFFYFGTSWEGNKNFFLDDHIDLHLNKLLFFPKSQLDIFVSFHFSAGA